jgi:predicted nucleic acid-binding protein
MILIIADASSLILLEKIALLDTLLCHDMSVMIPREVQKEAVEKGKMKKHPDAFKLEKKISQGQITVKDVKDKTHVRNLKESFKMETGEAEAISLFQQEQADLLATDDRFAMNACKALSIPVSGSAAFVTNSFEQGLINKYQGVQMLETLAKEGRYKDDIIFKALHKIQGGTP